MMKTGPNSARCFVWAIVGEFFFLSCFLILRLSCIYRFKYLTERPAMMETGPNRARCIICTIVGEHFNSSSFFGNDDENGH